MFINLTVTLLIIIVFAIFFGANGRYRGTRAEATNLGALIVAYFLVVLFPIVQRVVIWVVNLLLFVANAVVARVQGRPTDPPIIPQLNYDTLDRTWQLALSIVAFCCLAAYGYINSNRFRVKDSGKPPKVTNAKQNTGLVLGAVNAVFILGTLFQIAGPLDFSALNTVNLTIPSVNFRLNGTGDNPLANLPLWLPPLAVVVILILIVTNFNNKGLLTQSVTRVRTFQVLGIVLLIAAIITIAFLINRRV